jgi:hypothetical protein
MLLVGLGGFTGYGANAMEEAIKLVFPFLTTCKNYADVLKKLASFAFYETYFITLLLRSNAQYDSFFTGIETWGPIGGALQTIPHYDVLNLSGFVIAFGVAILTHMFQFHDRISDIFGIRRRFDCKHILILLAQRVGSTLNQEKRRKIVERRDELMHAVFYKYASSRAEKPLVDKHDIEQALTAWSWYWVFVEAIVYFSLGAFVAWWLGSTKLADGFVAVSLASFVLALVQRIRLPRYATPQVETIAGDATAAYDIKSRFDAI